MKVVASSTYRAVSQAARIRGGSSTRLDVVLMLAMLALSLIHTHGGSPLAYTLDVAIVLPLVWRRRAPVAVFSVIWVLAAAQGVIERPSVSDAALLIAFYTVASTADSRVTIALALVLELGVLAAALGWSKGSDEFEKVFIGLSGLATAAGVLGLNVRNRRATVNGLRERAEQLELGREREVALARATERGRIARDMHDVIAHNVSVMVALCDGAGLHVHDSPERVEEALEQAAGTGRQALAEMRQLLGVLREQGQEHDLAPLPGIREIENLIELIRAAGVSVKYTLAGDPSGLPPGMELTIYRIVQEALTNTLKHAGPGIDAAVMLTSEVDRITVEIRDNGQSEGATSGGGAGLRGMRERAAVYGGVLYAGPLPGGGWKVATSFVLAATPVAAGH